MARQQHYYALNRLHSLTANIYRRAPISDSDRFKLKFTQTLDDLRAELSFRIIGCVLIRRLTDCHLLIWPPELAAGGAYVATVCVAMYATSRWSLRKSHH